MIIALYIPPINMLWSMSIQDHTTASDVLAYIWKLFKSDFATKGITVLSGLSLEAVPEVSANCH
jgi:hypothetical protein